MRGSLPAHVRRCGPLPSRQSHRRSRPPMRDRARSRGRRLPIGPANRRTGRRFGAPVPVQPSERFLENEHSGPGTQWRGRWPGAGARRRKIHGRACRVHCARCAATRCAPSKKISPAVGDSIWARQRASVLLPDPEAPTSAIVQPARSVNETPSRARCATTGLPNQRRRCHVFSRSRVLPRGFERRAGARAASFYSRANLCAPRR